MALPELQPAPFDVLPAGVRRGVVAIEKGPTLSSGNPSVDRLLGGGFPRGALSEITGTESSGRTSIAWSVMAPLHGGEMAALVDPSDRFDPLVAAECGLDLSRLVWVRPPGIREALRATEILLSTQGFGVVVLDLADVALGSRWGFAWPRLARRATASGAALLLLSGRRLTGGVARLCLSLRGGRGRWPRHDLGPALLDGIKASAKVERIRGGVPGGQAELAVGG